jgi:peptidyl-prolyl cis-trans isomerase SurA
MSTLAALYTEDPGSAKTGGRYDGIMRGRFVPEFEAIAFRLKPGEVSEIFETQFGLHFMQLIARRGEMVDVRHILVTPKISAADVVNAKNKLDSIYMLLEEKKISFCDAAMKYSDDKETKNNCGTMVNMQTGNSRFETDELGQIDQNLIFLLDKMKIGDYTKPTLYQMQDSKQAYRIIYLKTRTEPHRANLKDDYQRLQNFAVVNKQKRLVKEWVNKKAKSTYIKLDPEYMDCTFENSWNLQPSK